MAEHTNLPSLTPADRDRLAAFRHLAYDVHRHLQPEYQRKLTVGAETNLIGERTLRSASQAIRLAMLEKESGYLPAVIDCLRLLHDPVVDRFVEQVNKDWASALKGRIHLQWNNTHSYDARELLDMWFYGRVFHQGPEYQADLKRIREFGEFGVLELQLTILSLGICILNLDNAIAHVLDEHPLALDETNSSPEEFF
jgi:hypothetical protein